jgi:hypothetical protein
MKRGSGNFPQARASNYAEKNGREHSPFARGRKGKLGCG